MARPLENAPIEFAVSSHPARAEWSVLRVSYRNTPAHESRVGRAIDALLGSANLGDGADDDTTSHELAEKASQRDHHLGAERPTIWQAPVASAPLAGVR